MKWKDVNKLHPTRRGVYTRQGVLHSLAISTGEDVPYLNRWISPTEIECIGEGKGPSDQTLDAFGNKTLIRAMHSNTHFRVYKKHAKNDWEDIGFWRVDSFSREHDPSEGGELIKFRLKKI